jgi:hypothetical protein
VDGVGEVTERHQGGVRDDSASTTRWVIDGKSLVIRMRDKGGQFRAVAGATYTLVKPDGGQGGAIDYTLIPAGTGVPPSTFRGVFELEGDTLKVCLPESPGRERATECKAAGGTNLQVLKRVADGRRDK